MKTPVSRFFTGAIAPVSGFRLLLSSRKIFLLSIIPFIIGFVFIGVGLVLASQYIVPFLETWLSFDQFVDQSPWFGSLLSFLILIVSWLVVAVFNFLFGYLCVILVAGPFYALLAEEVFRQQGFIKNGRAPLSLAMKMMLMGVSKVFIFSIVGVVCFVLTFIPVVNILSPIIIFSMVAFDCVDYSFEVDLLSLRKRFLFFRQNLYEFLGLSFVIFLTTFLPGSFFVFLPVFICGATKMYIQLAHKTV